MLQLVFGRAGYGKTEYVKQEIVDSLQDGEKNILLLVPEQFSFATGNTFLSLLGEHKYIDLEISDFTRLAHEVKKIYGGDTKPLIDKGGRAVLMFLAIQSVQDMLQLYTKNLTSFPFVESMLSMYTELKCCDVDFSQLGRVTAKIDKNTLQFKLQDIVLIMQAYEALVSENYLDSADDLTRLYEKLGEVDYLKHRCVYIDGFNGFTAQEMKILRRILCSAKNVVITLSADSMNDAENGMGIFSNVKRTAQQLTRLAKENNVSVSAPIKLEKALRYQNSDLEKLERSFMAPHKASHSTCDAIHLYCAKNIYDECDNVCRVIKQLLRSQAYRCREIAVIVRDLPQYQLLLENTFNAYEIPYYEDQRQPIGSQPLIRLVQYAVRCITNSFQTDDIISLAKTSLLSVSVNAICKLENYAVLWKINGKKWLQDFTEHPDGFASEFSDKEKAELELINQTRRKIVFPLLHLKKSCEDASGKAIAIALYEYLVQAEADKNLLMIAKELVKQNMSALSQEQNRIWDLLMLVLEQIALTTGQQPIKLKEFDALFALIISMQDLGNIPQGMDNIMIGTADRVSASAPKIVLLLGANEGAFPQNITNGGLLNDSDRQILSDLEIELFSDTSRLSIQEKFLTYSAISMPSEQLFASYCASDIRGNDLLPSIIVEQLKDIFPSLHTTIFEENEDLDLLEGKKASFELLASRWGENSEFVSSLKQYFETHDTYRSATRSIMQQANTKPIVFEQPKVATDLFGNNMFVSASKIETYYLCPFQYFCKFGMNAKPRRVAEMDPMQMGTLMHYVLEKLLREVGSKGLVALSAKQRQAKITSHLECYLLEEMGVADSATKRFRYLFLRLQKTICMVVEHMVEEFEQSDFECKAFELHIDRDAQISPLKVDLPDGGILEIRGCIDRVDVMEKEDKKYLRVVDYKSGSKEFLLSDVLEGLNMQMLIYLLCINENGTEEYQDIIPSAVLYMPVKRSISSLKRDVTKEELTSIATKQLKMKGLLLNDINVLKGMEKELKGKYVPVKAGKTISGTLISADQFGRLAKKIETLLCEMGQNLHDGKIEQHPVIGKNYKDTCQYCDYQSVCANQLDKQNRQLLDFEHENALKFLEEETDHA